MFVQAHVCENYSDRIFYLYVLLLNTWLVYEYISVWAFLVWNLCKRNKSKLRYQKRRIIITTNTIIIETINVHVGCGAYEIFASGKRVTIICCLNIVYMYIIYCHHDTCTCTCRMFSCSFHCLVGCIRSVWSRPEPLESFRGTYRATWNWETGNGGDYSQR